MNVLLLTLIILGVYLLITMLQKHCAEKNFLKTKEEMEKLLAKKNDYYTEKIHCMGANVFGHTDNSTYEYFTDEELDELIKFCEDTKNDIL
jgi:hypothetical protein